MEVRSAAMCIGKVNSNFLIGFLIHTNVVAQLFLADPEMRIRKPLSA